MRAVNLLPKDAERAARVAPNPALLVGVGLFAAIFAVLFSMYFNARQSLADQQDVVQELQAQVNAQKPKAKPLRIQQELAGAEPLRKAALSSALSYRLPWDVVLGQISRALPEDVSLVDLEAQAPTSPTTVSTPAVSSGGALSGSGPGVLSINGYAASQEEVARVISRLSVLPALATVGLVSSQRGSSPTAGNTASSVVTFTIVATLRQPGVSS
jgi:Tfp pilus assembly protein PilN